MLVAPPRRPRLVRAGRSPATSRSTRRYHDGSTRTRSGTLSTRRYHHGSTKINTTLSPRGYNFEGGRLGCHIYTCSRVRPGANQRFWLPPVTFPKPTPVLSGDACLFNNEVAAETPVDERGGESIASLDHFSQHVLTSCQSCISKWLETLLYKTGVASTTSCEYLRTLWARAGGSHVNHHHNSITASFAATATAGRRVRSFRPSSSQPQHHSRPQHHSIIRLPKQLGPGLACLFMAPLTAPICRPRRTTGPVGIPRWERTEGRIITAPTRGVHFPSFPGIPKAPRSH